MDKEKSHLNETNTEKKGFNPNELKKIVLGTGDCSQRLWFALDYLFQFTEEELKASQWKDKPTK